MARLRLLLRGTAGCLSTLRSSVAMTVLMS